MAVTEIDAIFAPLLEAAGAAAWLLTLLYYLSMVVQVGMGMALLSINNVLQSDAGYCMTRKKGQAWRRAIGWFAIVVAFVCLGISALAAALGSSRVPPNLMTMGLVLILFSYVVLVVLGISMMASGGYMPRGMWKVKKRALVVLGLVALAMGVAGLVFAVIFWFVT